MHNSVSILRNKDTFKSIDFLKENKSKEEEMKKEMLKKAYEEGFAAGYADSLADVKNLCSSLSAAIEGIDGKIRDIKENFEKDLLEISFAAAEKILQKELDREEYAVFFAEFFKNNFSDKVTLYLSDNNIKRLNILNEKENFLGDLGGKILPSQLNDDEAVVKIGESFKDISPKSMLEELKKEIRK